MKMRKTGSGSRLIRRLLIFVWGAFLLGAPAAKAAPTNTLVQDILYRADGRPAQGTLTIHWNGFTTPAGESIPAGELTATIGADGSITIPLIPNADATPAGSYYRVVYKLSDGTTSQEQWVVPATTQTTVAAVRTNVVSQTVAAQFASKDYVNQALAAVQPASLVHVAGTETITGAKSFTVSPEVPLPVAPGAAASKSYVDQQIGGLATVASTGNYNDLLNKPLGANMSSPGPIGSVAPNTVNATTYSVNGAALSSSNLSDSSSLAKTSQANTFSQPQTVTYTGGDTVAAALLVDASNSTIATNPVLKVGIPTTGEQRAMQAINAGDTKSWYSLEYNAGGPGKVGITLGPGGSTARDTSLYRSGVNELSTPGSLKLNSSITATTPAADIRAYGAVIDGATDIGPALASATLAACGSTAGSGVVLLPCGGSGCYLANGADLYQSNKDACSNSNQITYKIQGKLILGTTLVMPNNSSWVCDGGTGGGLFTPRGPNCTVQAPSVDGTVGTSITAGTNVTFTPTFTGGSISQIPVGSAITVAGTTTCSISSITRTSDAANNVTATLSSPQCRIPPGVVVTVAGVTDSSFNTTPVVTSSDYVAGTITWTQSGSATTSSGGTITGLNDDTFETVSVTANDGTNLTATFAHNHGSSDVFGVVGMMALRDSYTAHYVQGVNIANNYGAGFWFPHNAEVLLDGVGADEVRWSMSSIPAEFASSFGWRITNSSLTTQAVSGCGFSCPQRSYPYGLRITSLVGESDSSDLNAVVDGNTFIMGGVKIDTNDTTDGMVNKIGGLTLSNVTIEQPAGSGVTIDPRQVATFRPIMLNNVFLQDNFWNYPENLIRYTDPASVPATVQGTAGSVVINTLNATLMNADKGYLGGGGIANKYFNGLLTVKA